MNGYRMQNTRYAWVWTICTLLALIGTLLFEDMTLRVTSYVFVAILLLGESTRTALAAYGSKRTDVRLKAVFFELQQIALIVLLGIGTDILVVSQAVLVTLFVVFVLCSFALIGFDLKQTEDEKDRVKRMQDTDERP